MWWSMRSWSVNIWLKVMERDEEECYWRDVHLSCDDGLRWGSVTVRLKLMESVAQRSVIWECRTCHVMIRWGDGVEIFGWKWCKAMKRKCDEECLLVMWWWLRWWSCQCLVESDAKRWRGVSFEMSPCHVMMDEVMECQCSVESDGKRWRGVWWGDVHLSCDDGWGAAECQGSVETGGKRWRGVCLGDVHLSCDDRWGDVALRFGWKWWKEMKRSVVVVVHLSCVDRWGDGVSRFGWKWWKEMKRSVVRRCLTCHVIMHEVTECQGWSWKCWKEMKRSVMKRCPLVMCWWMRWCSVKVWLKVMEGNEGECYEECTRVMWLCMRCSGVSRFGWNWWKEMKRSVMKRCTLVMWW